MIHPTETTIIAILAFTLLSTRYVCRLLLVMQHQLSNSAMKSKIVALTSRHTLTWLRKILTCQGVYFTHCVLCLNFRVKTYDF